MEIGILKEDERVEHRAALSPAGVQSLTGMGNAVYVQKHAGLKAMFTDEEYENAGATIVYSPEEIINRSQIVLKVSPPTIGELEEFEKGQLLFSFLHLAVSQEKLMKTLLQKNIAAVSYELIENSRGELSVLQVMSEIAGHLSMQVAAHYLQVKEGGRGILLGSLPGVPPASVVVLGAGTVGRTASRVALGMGASVTVIDHDLSRLRDIENLFQWRVSTAVATHANIRRSLRHADVLIGSILLKGEKAPHVVSEAMVKEMKVGSVIIDVSIDQGGCVETSRPTHPDDPAFVRHGVVHYCVPNMASSVPRTATIALTNALLPYIRDVAELGIQRAIQSDPGLAKGVCVFEGNCTSPPIAKALNLQSQDLGRLLRTMLEPMKN
ncbi:MAG: alanine dehydrogenase [Ignavibacteriales bacterium]|nr:alanine dehydrogenase [Ignavibacteriales bacterium]